MSWMQQNLGTLGSRTLRQICLPGSHDSGMSQFGAHTAFARECNTITQVTGILGQLQFGVRYFDVRPVIGGGQYLTGHYTFVGHGLGTQGANGQSIESIVADVNSYTATNKELVMLYLSHDMNTDAGQPNYPGFSQEEWEGLLAQLQNLDNLFTFPDTTVDLTLLTLSDFIANGAAVVVVVDTSPAPEINLGSLAGNGFYTPANFQVYNNYSDTNDLATMQGEQLSYMTSVRKGSPPGYFLLSWTLTQDIEQAAVCSEDDNSILALAKQANATLPSVLLPSCQGQTYPNIIYVDGIDSSDFTSLAMTINRNAAG